MLLEPGQGFLDCRSMTASTPNHSTSQLVDLAGMIQSIAAQRRGGVLTVTSAEREVRRLGFQGGQLVALAGPSAGFFAKALVWAQVLTPEQLTVCLGKLGKNFTHEQLAEHLLAQNLANRDGLLDAIDCYIEEGFSDAVAFANPRIEFNAELPKEPWFEFQTRLGVSINPGSLLLEGLRRQDELASITGLLPDPWDALILDRAKSPPADLSADARLVIEGWREGLIAHILLDRSLLPPFRASTTLALLLRLGLVRIATTAEVVVQADAAHSHGRHREAYGLYRRAQIMGMDSPRLHLHIAELAERFGENEVAAAAYVTAATALNDPGHAVVLLRNALSLAADRLPALAALLAIYQQLGEHEDAIGLLLEIARLNEVKGDRDQAIQAVRQAQEYGADKVVCASTLARLAAANGDTEQAALQYELAAHAAQFGGRNEEAVASWRALLALKPDNLEYARECSDLMASLGLTDDAVTVLRAAIQRGSNAGDDALIPLHEALARLDTVDSAIHDWLAQAYSRQRDRDGAVAQLLVIADMRERAGNPAALASTLERIVELGGAKAEVWVRLAQVRTTLQQSGLAAAAWCSAIDACVAQGSIKEARALFVPALENHAGYLPLRTRQALVMNRDNDPAGAADAFRAAAHLARGAGQLLTAKEMLQDLARLKPDDLVVRIELAKVARDLKDDDLGLYFREVVRLAARTGNQGLAVDYARRRVATAEGPEALAARSELVELLRRSGDSAGELSEGKTLLDQLLEQGAFEQAVQLLSRLVASHNRNADLMLQLADLFQAMDDERQAQRFYHHVVVLFQVEGRLDEARRVLDQLLVASPDDLAVPLARERIAQGQVIDWEAIRQSLAADERRRLAGTMGVPAPDAPQPPQASGS